MIKCKRGFSLHLLIEGRQNFFSSGEKTIADAQMVGYFMEGLFES